MNNPGFLLFILGVIGIGIILFGNDDHDDWGGQ